MPAPHPDYELVRDRLKRGQKLTVADVATLTGRTRENATVLLGNLKMNGFAETCGRNGHCKIFQASARLLEGEEAARAGAARGPKGAAAEMSEIDAGLRCLMRALRIGPPPASPFLRPRQVYGRSGLHAHQDGDEAAA